MTCGNFVELEMRSRAMGDEPRVELFARRPRDGWDVWGNEVECTAKLSSLEDIE